jgi:hypothetical protein
MSVVGFHVESRLPDRDTTIVVSRGIIDQTLGNRPRIMPKCPARPRINRECVIRRRHKHDPIYNDRSHLEKIGVAGVKHPLSAQLSYVARIDLCELRVTLPGIVAVIRRPVLGNRFDEQVGCGHGDRTGVRLFARNAKSQTYDQTNKRRHGESGFPQISGIARPCFHLVTFVVSNTYIYDVVQERAA